ncbi:MAG TPA: hypothetical protein VER98_00315 [Terriglobia bacterium]|nr:hypothetical protein [Terriglobia bacterium]
MSKPVVLSLNTLTGHKVQNAAGEDLGKIEDACNPAEEPQTMEGVEFIESGSTSISVEQTRRRGSRAPR